MAVHRIFVYGTLKRGYPNNYFLLDSAKYGVAKFLGVAELVKKYPLVIATVCNIPFLLGAEGKGKQVTGELYEVDDKILAKLDDLEKHPHIYTRTTVQCLVQFQSSVSEKESVSSSKVVASSLMDCEVYMLNNYKPSLFSLPFLTSYDHDTIKGRVYERQEDSNVYAAVKDL